MATTATVGRCPRPAAMTLDACLLQVRLAELVVLSRYRRLSHMLRSIGTAELTTVTRLEQVILLAQATQQAMKLACRVVEPRAVVPLAVCDASLEYQGAWAEPQALVDDLILYAEAYQDVLRDQELSHPGECYQRQVMLRTQHAHLIRALAEGFYRISVWKVDVRKDGAGECSEIDEDFDDASLMEGGKLV
ncbi:hypothetical protein KDH_80210 [Dictyobacter sp. S3.2.2.5]|uniref:Uncharacterized protein n=1 Tax=Dictyobacter halimunensis TaxID=3026934 RepID=A0ABQ6G992_9CHLR|nr:hypothetical protein KDH_80210 [Dictyobacter sp. S3.2.2.5]